MKTIYSNNFLKLSEQVLVNIKEMKKKLMEKMKQTYRDKFNNEQ